MRSVLACFCQPYTFHFVRLPIFVSLPFSHAVYATRRHPIRHVAPPCALHFPLCLTATISNPTIALPLLFSPYHQFPISSPPIYLPALFLDRVFLFAGEAGAEARVRAAGPSAAISFLLDFFAAAA